jgi:cell pole-organizing protein PopZ
MTDRQSTPSPETEPSVDPEVHATQVIRAPDPTLAIQLPLPATEPTTAIPLVMLAEPIPAPEQPTPPDEPPTATQQPTPPDEPPMAAQQPTGATAQVAARVRAEAEKAREAAVEAQAVADKSRWKAEDRAAQPWYLRKRVALPSAVLAAFAFLMVTTGGNDSGLFRAVTNAAQPTSQAVPHAPPASAVMGQSVRDGKFAFMVTAMPKPAKSFTDRFGVKQSAQGIFVIVRVTVSNIGYDARSLDPTDLFLVDNQGKRFATSSAILTFSGAETIFLHDINPGHSVKNAPVLFDVAPGTVVASIELHDSPSSKGVQVKLP